MQIPSALSSSLYGIQKGLDGMNKNAAQIANAKVFNPLNSVDFAKPLMDLRNNHMQAELSAKTMESLDGAFGTLLDVVA